MCLKPYSGNSPGKVCVNLCVYALVFQAVPGHVERWAVSPLPLTDEAQGHNKQSYPVTMFVCKYLYTHG